MTAPLTLEDIRPNYPAPGVQQLGSAGGDVTAYVQRQLTATEPFAQMKYRLAARNLLMSDGRQYIDWNKGRGAWVDMPVLDGEIRTTVNYLKPILRSLTQRILSADFTWKCTPRTNSHEERDKATVTETLLTARWDKTDMDGKTRSGLYFAQNCGVSYLKSFWNSTIGPQQQPTVTLPNPVSGEPTEYPVDAEGNPLMDEQGAPVEEGMFTYRPGDTDTTLRSVFNIRVNPGASGLEPDEGFRWLLDVDLLPISVIKEQWGSVAKNVTVTGKDSITQQYTRLVSALGPGFFGVSPESLDDSADPTTLYVEYWEDKSAILPDGRLCVMAGGVLLYDDKLPQGFVPYAPVYDERRPFDPSGRARVDDLAPLQRQLNADVSALCTQNRLDGIGQWIGFDVPGVMDQISNGVASMIRVPMRGMALNRSIGDLVQRVPPTPVNQARIQSIEMTLRQMFDIGAYHEIQRGQVPPGVDSGVAVHMLQEAENAQLNDTVRQLKLSLIKWGRHQLAMARWGYGENEERWLPAGDKSLDYLVESVKGPDLPDPQDVDISLEGFHPKSEASQRAEIIQGVQLGVIAPREALQLLPIGRGLKGAWDSENRQYSKARRENLAIEEEEFFVIPAPEMSPTAGGAAFMHINEQGEMEGPFLLPNLDDHQRHIEVHNEIALDDTKPWPIREAVILHISEHQAMLAQQAMAMMATDPNAPKGAPADQLTEATV